MDSLKKGDIQMADYLRHCLEQAYAALEALENET